jgi:CBS domain-containing protein
VNYAELKSGQVELNGEQVKTSSLSSYRRAKEVALTLKGWVEQGKMTLALPTRPIDPKKAVRPMRETSRSPRVQDIMDRNVVSIIESEAIQVAATKLLKGETNHLVVVDREGCLAGVVTTYDVSKAIVHPKKAQVVRDIMTRKVITATPDEAVDIAAQKLERYNISALPVIDAANRVQGMLTAIDLGKLFGGRWRR